METKLVLVLEVTYQHLRKSDVPALRQQLNGVVQDAAGNGTLSGTIPGVEVSEWHYRVGEAKDVAVLLSRQKDDLAQLLDYSAAAEQEHYEECKREGNGRMHIWHSIKRLAKALNHKI